MNILLAGFKGADNSSKLILDGSSGGFEKLYLENDFDISSKQIRDAIIGGKYGLILALGQKPVIKSIYIETTAKGHGAVLNTRYDYNSLASYLKNNGYKTKISNNAGNYLCNHVYFQGLSAIEHAGSSADMLFLHVPTVKNNPNTLCISSAISLFLEKH